MPCAKEEEGTGRKPEPLAGPPPRSRTNPKEGKGPSHSIRCSLIGNKKKDKQNIPDIRITRLFSVERCVHESIKKMMAVTSERVKSEHTPCLWLSARMYAGTAVKRQCEVGAKSDKETGQGKDDLVESPGKYILNV